LFPKLISLDISNNEFSDLPMGFDRFTELKYLYINDNPRVTHIPRNIGYISCLSTFEYHDVADPVTAALNDISDISDKLTYLRSMQQRYVATIPIAMCAVFPQIKAESLISYLHCGPTMQRFPRPIFKDGDTVCACM